MNKTIAVSILGKEHKVRLVNNLISQNYNFIHYDIMDGKFVPNVSLEENEMNFILKNTKDHIINLHLMVYDSEKYILMYKDSVDYITFHYEAESIDNIKKIIKKHGFDVNLGLAINPSTNVEQIYEFLPFISHVLIMSVIPGQGGQKFIPETLDKIKKLSKYLKNRNFNCFIQVDGGINDKTGPLAFSAGAQNVVSGSFLLKNINCKNICQKIKGEI